MLNLSLKLYDYMFKLLNFTYLHHQPICCSLNVNNMNDCDVIIEISQRGQQTASNHAVSDSLVTPLKNIETYEVVHRGDGAVG